MKTYLAIIVQDGGKYYSYAKAVSHSDNLASILAGIKGLESANICKTKKEAAQLVNFWNDCYKANGTAMFGEVFA